MGLSGSRLGWLARFDGIRFTHFNAENTPELLSPEILKLQVDDRGLLWIADIDGRLITHWKGTFESKLPSKPGYSKHVTRWLGRHGNEDRFLTGSGALLRLDDRAIYENEANPPPPRPDSIVQFHQDQTGTLWCRTLGGKLGRWSHERFEPE